MANPMANPMAQSNINSEKIIDIINSFNRQIDMNSFLINEKIKNKMCIINNLYNCGFPILNYDETTTNNIISRLSAINKQNAIVSYSNEISLLLGKILHNMYEYSGYQVLVSNMPEYGIMQDNNLVKIDSEVIYDTMEKFSGNHAMVNVVHVIQITSSKYLVKFYNNDNARKVCDLLHNNLVGNNIISVEYIKQTANPLSSANPPSSLLQKMQQYQYYSLIDKIMYLYEIISNSFKYCLMPNKYFSIK